MVDSADREKLNVASTELRNLLKNSQLVGIPVLVLGNKHDLPAALPEHELIQALELSSITDRATAFYSISCLENYNIGKRLSRIMYSNNKIQT